MRYVKLGVLLCIAISSYFIVFSENDLTTTQAISVGMYGFLLVFGGHFTMIEKIESLHAAQVALNNMECPWCGGEIDIIDTDDGGAYQKCICMSNNKCVARNGFTAKYKMILTDLETW